MKYSSHKGFWIGAAFLLAFGIARVLTMEAVAQSREDIIGKKAPELVLDSVSGEQVSLAKMEGRVVALDFWAVWCGPCKDSMPFFQEMQDKYGKDGLEVVGVHVDDRMPEPAKVEEYLAKLGVNYTNLVSTVDVDNAYMIYAMPTTYIIDRKGVIVKRHIGFNPAKTPQGLEEEFRQLLGLD